MPTSNCARTRARQAQHENVEKNYDNLGTDAGKAQHEQVEKDYGNVGTDAHMDAVVSIFPVANAAPRARALCVQCAQQPCFPSTARRLIPSRIANWR